MCSARSSVVAMGLPIKRSNNDIRRSAGSAMRSMDDVQRRVLLAA
jgi:hypothetical protein